ncbi:MAG: DUF6263 family protein [Phycisphaeraceae bacterium]
MTHHARLTTSLLIATFALALQLGGGAAAAQDTLDLRPIWKEGQSARYRMTTTQTTLAEMQGIPDAQPQQTTTLFEGELTWRVTRADENGGGEAEMTIDDLRMTITGPDGEQRSASPQSADEMMEPVQQMLTALVGRPISYVITADGNVDSVQGYDAIQRQAGEMGASMDERYFRNLGLDTLALVGGSQNMNVGSSWQSQQSSSHQFGEITADVTYTLAGVEEPAGVPTVMIERTASLDLSPELPDLPPDGPEVAFQQLAGEANGFLMFDRSRNEVVGVFEKQVLSAEVSFITPDRRMTQTMTETTDTEVLRIAEE